MPAMRTVLVLVSLGFLAAGCGDNLTAGNPDGSEIDASSDGRIDAPIDANCPLRQPGQVGGPCTTDAQCNTAGMTDGFCLDATDAGIGWPAVGYCVTKIGVCTMDSECGAGNVCVTINDPVTPFSACMPACSTDPGCACGNGQVCSNNLATSPMNKMACIPGNTSAVDGDPCTGFGECDINSICRNDQAEHPGGQCIQIGCTLGNDATCTSGGDGHCANPGFVSAGAGCLDECANDSECRMAEGYKCFDAGGATGRYCRHPQTGDACATDTDCGDAATWDCRTGIGFLGGYCTLAAACDPSDGSGCSSGSSICYDPPGGGTGDAYCVDRCTGSPLQGTCRTGYLCSTIGQAAGCI
jgi:hypothetical protein